MRNQSITTVPIELTKILTQGNMNENRHLELGTSMLTHNMSYAYASVGDVRNGNDECRNCAFISRCTAGCRNTALIKSNNYYAVDPEVCVFHKHGWEDRMKQIIEPAYAAYKARNKIQ